MKNQRVTAALCALLAAVFYAVNTPFSKVLLQYVPATLMAAFLYLGAGLGMGVIYLFHRKNEPESERLSRRDLPYTIGMIVLDIAAPIFLMLGIRLGSAANASLLGNFEIVATTFIALLLFREAVSKKLWFAISLITLSGLLLSFDGQGLTFSSGSLLVLAATLCWGLENNCTRQISDKSAYEIVLLKGVFSGGGSLVIGRIIGEKMPQPRYILFAMLLGFVAYGLSIFLYIKAQKKLGAAKTSAYYAAAPFIGSLLAFAVLGEKLTGTFFAAFLIMLCGSAFVVCDTLETSHTHRHTHTVCHTHDGSTHTHCFTHEHFHRHWGSSEKHTHTHTHRGLFDDREHLSAHHK